MVFNSFTFCIFFILVYSLYLLLQSNFKWQNRMLLAASCIFYGWWDWRFLFLMGITILIDYFMGLSIYRTEDPAKRKRLLSVSVIANLGILGFFKYFNFFQESLMDGLSSVGLHLPPHFLNIALPIGVSFYTFQSMSYTIDNNRKEMIPSHSLLDFAVFVTYFPHLVAGPILRATKLLPQILSPRTISLDQFYEGWYLIFWGFYQKVFVADNLAKIVNPIFDPASSPEGLLVLVGLYAFAFQILCDFSGYSDIARGLGKIMGFDIAINFNAPYFSKNPSEFWQRWHISLSTWLRDYLYIPLGGNQKGAAATFRNLMITMLLGGLWHGANWTFVIWGAFHGFLLIFYRLVKAPLEQGIASWPRPARKVFDSACILFFFHLVCLGWLFFRAQSISQAGDLLHALIFNFSFSSASLFKINFLRFIFFVWLFIGVQILYYYKNDLLVILKTPVPVRVAFYTLCFYLFMIYGATGGEEFIYFQF